MPPKILLVDDVKMFLELQRGFLKLSSVQVLTAADGVEAIEVARREKPELIFMDLHMPRLDGAACCRSLKSDPALKDIPVVMVTAAGKEEDRLLCHQAGCNDYITKPLDRVLFLEKARQYLPDIDRREKRFPVRLKAKFRAYGVTLSSEACDISHNGIYLSTTYEVQVGTVLEVAISLPDPLGIVETQGRVAWLNAAASRRKLGLPVGFGIEFVAISPEARSSLKRFLETKG